MHPMISKLLTVLHLLAEKRRGGRKGASFRNGGPKVAAFSLLEMAFAIATLGVIVSISLPLVTESLKLKKRRALLEKVQYIESALGQFYLENERLPLPATESDSGVEPPASGSCKPVQRGFIPFRALGLPQTLCQDGAGRPLQYAVITPATDRCGRLCSARPGTSQQPEAQSRASAPLQVLDRSGRSVATKHPVVCVLLGRYEPIAAPQLHARERETLSDSPLYHDAPYAASTTASPNRVLVRWTTLVNLLGPEGCLYAEKNHNRKIFFKPAARTTPSEYRSERVRFEDRPAQGHAPDRPHRAPRVADSRQQNERQEPVNKGFD